MDDPAVVGAGFLPCTAMTLGDGNGVSGLRELERGCEACYAAADDQRVDGFEVICRQRPGLTVGAIVSRRARRPESLGPPSLVLGLPSLVFRPWSWVRGRNSPVLFPQSDED